MTPMRNSNKGAIAVVVYLLYAGIAALALFGVHEYRVLTSPDRDKKGADAHDGNRVPGNRRAARTINPWTRSPQF